MDTIFAQSSAPGKAGVSLFRISGPEAWKIISILANQKNVKTDKVNLLTLSHQKEIIDKAIILAFKSPKSFTGEDVIEIHTHGSIAIASLLTKAILTTKLARLAEPGEFAKRAFNNNKIDLTRAEGLADLIDAETIMQHRQAMRQMSGELEKLYNEWRKKLLSCISLIEAYIDFPDEDIPDSVLGEINSNIEAIKLNLRAHLDDKRQGERLRNGLKLTIFGLPNVGKSSLLNHFAKRDIAIVSSIAGTTRDIIETHIDLGGYPIILTDTAGINPNTKDLIEQEGIRRAIDTSINSDIKILMLDATNQNLVDNIEEYLDQNTIIVINKTDLEKDEWKNHPIFSAYNLIKISMKTGAGIEELTNEIIKLSSEIARPSETPSITRERYRHNIKQALESLNHFDLNEDLLLAAEDVRIAIRSLESITGKVTVDEILGEIFANFCIGK